MFPDLHQGIRLFVLCWRPKRQEPENRQHRLGERPYMCGVGFGQRLFAILLRAGRNPAEISRFQCGDDAQEFKPGHRIRHLNQVSSAPR